MISNFSQYLLKINESSTDVLSRAENALNIFKTTMLYTWKNEYNKAMFSDLIPREKKVQLNHLIDKINDNDIPSLGFKEISTELENTLNQLDTDFREGKDVDDDYYLEIENMITIFSNILEYKIDEFIKEVNKVINLLGSLDESNIIIKTFEV